MRARSREPRRRPRAPARTRHAAHCAAPHLRPATPRADDKVSSELKTNIMKARLEKKMTQAQLAQARATRAFASAPLCRTLGGPCADSPRCIAQAINELPKIVQDYEAGKAIPNQQIISKMERALGVPLRPKKK